MGLVWPLCIGLCHPRGEVAMCTCHDNIIHNRGDFGEWFCPRDKSCYVEHDGMTDATPKAVVWQRMTGATLALQATLSGLMWWLWQWSKVSILEIKLRMSY